MIASKEINIKYLASIANTEMVIKAGSLIDEYCRNYNIYTSECDESSVNCVNLSGSYFKI